MDLKKSFNVKSSNCDVRYVHKIHVKFDDDCVGRKVKHVCVQGCSGDCLLVGSVPISPVEKEFLSYKYKSKKVWVKRFQLPLTLCYACTVHKTQGLTLSKAFISLASVKKGQSWKNCQGYTAISRLKSLSGLLFLAFYPNQIRTSESVIREYERLRSLSQFDMFGDRQLPPPTPIPTNKIKTSVATIPTKAIVINVSTTPQKSPRL